MLKTSYYKSSLVANVVQTCSHISIDNGMYTICSYDSPQRTGRLIELETEQVKLYNGIVKV